MSETNPILARFQNNEPVLIDPHAHSLLTACAHQAALILARIENASDTPRMDTDGFWFAPDDWRAAYRPYVVKDGVLQIPVKGVLLNDFTYSFGSWATGYQYIWRAFERGLRDPEVKGIALVCDTPGGMVAGNFELVDKMFAARGQKPIRGFAHEAAYSAGYSIISVADTVVVSRTGGVGSIGVVTSHVDVSGAMEQRGWVITFIHAGKHKVDGNPYAALPEDVKARIQTRIDDLYSIFVSTVARNRGMSEQAVRETEALTYSAPEAISIGLADSIGPFDDALADFAASFEPSEGDENMAELTQADIDAAVATATASHTAALAAARTEGAVEGATAERGRISAILDSPEAAERPASLAKLPVEKAVAPEGKPAGGKGDRFERAMDATGNPDLGDASGQGDDGGEPMSKADSVFALRGKTRAKVA